MKISKSFQKICFLKKNCERNSDTFPSGRPSHRLRGRVCLGGFPLDGASGAKKFNQCNAGCEIGQIWTNAVNQMTNFCQIKLSNRFNLNFQDVERLGDMDIDLLTGVTGWQREWNGKIQPLFFPGRLPPGGHLLQLLIQLWLWPTMHRPGTHLGRLWQDQPQAGGGADPSSNAGHPEQRDCPLWTEQPPADRHKPHPGSQQPSS